MFSRLFLLLVYFGSTASIVGGSFFLAPGPQKYSITPQDATALIGESLVVTCTIIDSSDGVEPTDLSFRVESKGLLKDYVAINTTNTTARAVIEITPDFEITKGITLSCRNSNGDQLLKSTFIYSEYAPRNISNVAIVAQWLGYLNITWALGDYLRSNTIDVQAVWNPDAPPTMGNECTIADDTTCKIQTFGQTTIYVRVTVELTKIDAREQYVILNKQPEKAETLLPIVVGDHIQPKPVTNFDARNKNGSCVDAFWSDPLYFNVTEKPSIYVITGEWLAYGSALVSLGQSEDSNQPVEFQGLRGFSSSRQPVPLCGLQPYSQYKWTLRVKPENKGYFSDDVFVHTATGATLPKGGPEMVTFWSERCNNPDDTRRVRVLWNPLPTSSWHGGPERYEVTSTSPSATDNPNPVPISPNGNYYEETLPCSQPGRLTVSSVNEKGRSPLATEVVVPKAEELFQLSDRLDARVEEAIGADQLRNLSILWDTQYLPKTSQPLQLNLYYCVGSYSNSCFGDLHKRTVSATEGSLPGVVVPLNQTLYGFSIEEPGGRTSGVQWITCIYQPNNVPSQAAKTPIAKTGGQRDSIEVTWLVDRCDPSSKIYLVKVHVFLCKNRQMDDHCLHEVIDPFVSRHTFTGLTKDHEYAVYLQTETLGGLAPVSQPAFATPTNSDLTTSQIAGIAMGACISFIITGAVIFCFARKCKRRKEKLKSEAFGSSPMYGLMEESSTNPTLDQQESRTDSGRFTMQPESPLRPTAVVAPVPSDPPPVLPHDAAAGAGDNASVGQSSEAEQTEPKTPLSQVSISPVESPLNGTNSTTAGDLPGYVSVAPTNSEEEVRVPGYVSVVPTTSGEEVRVDDHRSSLTPLNTPTPQLPVGVTRDHMVFLARANSVPQDYVQIGDVTSGGMNALERTGTLPSNSDQIAHVENDHQDASSPPSSDYQPLSTLTTMGQESSPRFMWNNPDCLPVFPPLTETSTDPDSTIKETHNHDNLSDSSSSSMGLGSSSHEYVKEYVRHNGGDQPESSNEVVANEYIPHSGGDQPAGCIDIARLDTSCPVVPDSTTSAISPPPSLQDSSHFTAEMLEYDDSDVIEKDPSPLHEDGSDILNFLEAIAPCITASSENPGASTSSIAMEEIDTVITETDDNRSATFDTNKCNDGYKTEIF